MSARDSADEDLHMLLACGMFPLLMLPLSWWVAVRRGVRRLLLVAGLDTVLGVGLIGAILLQGAPIPPEPDPPRIGVQLDAAYPEEGARVLAVWPDSPAEEAGLRAGDVIVAVDGEAVGSWEGMTEALERTSAGSSRRLTVERDAGTVTLDVTPRTGLGKAEPRRLFDPMPGAECPRASVADAAASLWPVGAAGVIILAVSLVGRARPRRWGLQRWVLVLVPLAVAPLVGAASEAGVCRIAGGASLGALLVALLAQGLTLLGLGWLLRRWLAPELGVLVSPRLSTVRATSLAVFYILAAMARALTVIYIVFSLVPELAQGRGEPIRALFDGAQSLPARALVIAAAVVVAPIAEEVIFRGILLPGLARNMRPGLALALSAALFALFHVPSHGLSAIFPGVLALALGWARLRTGSLAAPIALHAANNLLVTLLAWLL